MLGHLRRLPRTEKSSARLTSYGPGAIDWSAGVAQAAAYVTARDSVVGAIAVALNNLGNVATAQGDHAAARAFYEDVLGLPTGTGSTERGWIEFDLPGGIGTLPATL